MGNTVSKVADTVLRNASAITGGLLGKSDEGFHIGPLRLTKKSIGVKLNVGICKVDFQVGKNRSGEWETQANIEMGIKNNAEFSVRAKMNIHGAEVRPMGYFKAGNLKVLYGVVVTKRGIEKIGVNVRGRINIPVNYEQIKTHQPTSDTVRIDMSATNRPTTSKITNLEKQMFEEDEEDRVENLNYVQFYPNFQLSWYFTDILRR